MVNLKDLQVIVNQFDIQSGIEKIETLESGHINDTYLVTTHKGKCYVLQKLNTNVFKDIESIITNKAAVSEHLKQLESPYKSVSFVKAKDSNYYYKDNNGNYWNIMDYISNCVTHDVASNTKMVFEAGKLYGDFIKQTASLSSSTIKETLPSFHSVPLRFLQFEKALKKASSKNIANAKREIDFAIKCKEEMSELAILKNEDVFPIRITHNDAKLSNILFNQKEEGLAVIDLDTIMPGIVHFDFGDSIRSICTNTIEDSNDFENTFIKLDYYKAFCEGHAQATKDILTHQEIKYLPLGVKTIIFIMGLRFLTDFLNENIYYKVKYKSHNLIRCKNQFKLVKSVQQHYDNIIEITNKCYNLNNIS